MSAQLQVDGKTVPIVVTLDEASTAPDSGVVRTLLFQKLQGMLLLGDPAQGYVYERRMTQRNPTRGQPVVNTTGPRGISVFEHLSQSRQLYEHPGNPLEPERSSS